MLSAGRVWITLLPQTRNSNPQTQLPVQSGWSPTRTKLGMVPAPSDLAIGPKRPSRRCRAGSVLVIPECVIWPQVPHRPSRPLARSRNSSRSPPRDEWRTRAASGSRSHGVARSRAAPSSIREPGRDAQLIARRAASPVWPRAGAHARAIRAGAGVRAVRRRPSRAWRGLERRLAAPRARRSAAAGRGWGRARLGPMCTRRRLLAHVDCFQAPALGSATLRPSDSGGRIPDGPHFGIAYCDGSPHTDGAVRGIIVQEKRHEQSLADHRCRARDGGVYR